MNTEYLLGITNTENLRSDRGSSKKKTWGCATSEHSLKQGGGTRDMSKESCNREVGHMFEVHMYRSDRKTKRNENRTQEGEK